MEQNNNLPSAPAPGDKPAVSHWHAGYNQPGYLPEAEPDVYASFEAAREGLADDMEHHAATQESRADPHDCDDVLCPTYGDDCPWPRAATSESNEKTSPTRKDPSGRARRPGSPTGSPRATTSPAYGSWSPASRETSPPTGVRCTPSRCRARSRRTQPRSPTSTARWPPPPTSRTSNCCAATSPPSANDGPSPAGRPRSDGGRRDRTTGPASHPVASSRHPRISVEKEQNGCDGRE